MRLVDWQIRERYNMIVPWNEQQCNPHSYDVLLGEEILLEKEDYGWCPPHQLIDDPYGGSWVRIYIGDYTPSNPLWLRPGQFILACTNELLYLPDDVEAVFHLKSSLARAGYNHSLAGYCDAGFNGSRLTLELKNNKQHRNLPLWYTMPIGQLVFMQLDKLPEKRYSAIGHYNNDPSVQAAKV